MPAKIIRAADLFCGAGGTSSGLAEACSRAGLDLDLLAVNHWQIAVDTHSRNHPRAKHLCTTLDGVSPLDHIPGGRLELLVASPECVHFSSARGGRPMSDQSRASAWLILKWLQDLYVENVLIENVPEFRSWGPLGADGRPLRSKKGSLFVQFLNNLKALGYAVDYQILNAADYGDATTRERLFIIARRGNKRITWPEPTHAPASAIGKQTLFEISRRPWRTAREIIDWSIPGKSIFRRKKPLAPATLERIAAGIRKFAGPWAEPFLVILRGNQTVRSIDDPVPTVTTSGAHIGVCEFVVPQFSEAPPKSADEPLGTITTTSRGVGICEAVAQPEAFLVEYYGQGGAQPITGPMPTVTCKDRFGVVEPQAFMLGQQSGSVARAVDDPVPTVAGGGAISLIEPFVLPHRAKDGADSIDDPMRTVTASSSDFALVEPEAFLIGYRGNHFGQNDAQRRSYDLAEPLRTQDTANRYGLVEPTAFIVAAGGPEGKGRNPHSVDEPLGTVLCEDKTAVVEPKAFVMPVNHGAADKRTHELDAPMPTITTVDAWSLVEPFVVERDGRRYQLDIRFRMLTPRELARAQGFPDDYEFAGNREQVVKQIGNAVCVNLAAALCAELLKEKAAERVA